MNETPAIQTVAIIGKPALVSERAYLLKIETMLKKAGKTVLFEEAIARGLRRSGHSFAMIKKQADLVLVFGGDGTFLLAARKLLGCHAYFIGSKLLGTLGFLTEHDPANLPMLLRQVLGGNFTFDERVVLVARVRRGDKIVRSLPAMNEAVIGQHAISRLIQLDLATEKQAITSYRADGLIVATPTGSTAYSLAAGGPIVYPSLDAFIITPINPHILANRPIAIPDTFELRVTIHDSDVALTVDGQDTVKLRAGDVVELEKAPSKLKVIHPKDRNYFGLLRKKLHWGAQNCEL